MDVPYPPDYGGAIDIYYRIQALNELGYKIILHCWEYGRGEQEKLNPYTHEVHYYKRVKSPKFAFSKLPFIVVSRQSNKLFQRLLNDTHPILFEGIHTTLLLNNPRLKDRIKMVRMHNIEHDYYIALSQKSKGWKTLYYRNEAKKLKNYEPVLKHAEYLLAIQENDRIHLSKFHPQVKLLPASVPPISIVPAVAAETYCLFHGNLNVQENDLGAKWILNNVMSNNIKMIIAGKNPSQELVSLAKEKEAIIISNPSEDEMQKLISEARVHLLVTQQATGIKLKLINALSSGGHVLANSIMLEGTNLESLCTIFKDKNDCRQQLKKLMQKPVEVSELHRRFEILQAQFDTYENCKVFNELLSFERS